MSAGPPALLCTDDVAARYGERIRRTAPQLDLVALAADDHLAEADLARLQVAFFSGDAWPERSAHFMGTVVRAPSLRWLHTFSAGTDHPVFAGLLDRGVRVSSSSGASAGAIGGTVLMYLLALSRGLPRLQREQTAHRWAPQRFDDLPGGTVGVVGMGPIGREVIRLTTGVGMRAIGVRRKVIGDEPCATWPLSRLGDLAAVVDALVVALPLTDDTRGIISAPILGRMSPSAVFVNVGRGELVDEAALIEALTEGRLSGAGLDVFATEPLPANSPLWDLPNVIITPHSAGMTPRSDDEAAEMFLSNLAAYAEGTPLINER